MRVAVLADIHGNLPALEAVLAEVERDPPDLVMVCGDVASGPMPAESIDVLRGLPRARFVRGNADRGLVEGYDGAPFTGMPGPFVDWCVRQLSRDQRDFLASFEDVVTVEVAGVGRVLFCHGSPRSDVEVMTIETEDDRVRELLSGLDVDMVVCGHTHMQFDRTVDGVRVINFGSVGMPYGEPGAFWGWLGPGVELRRSGYDREAAAALIRATDWPNAEEFARENVLSVASEEEALAFMRELDLKQRSKSS